MHSFTKIWDENHVLLVAKLLLLAGSLNVFVTTEPSELLSETHRLGLNWTLTDCFSNEELEILLFVDASLTKNRSASYNYVRQLTSNVVSNLQTSRIEIFAFLRHRSVSYFDENLCDHCVFHVLNATKVDERNILLLANTVHYIRQSFFKSSILRPLVALLVIDEKDSDFLNFLTTLAPIFHEKNVRVIVLSDGIADAIGYAKIASSPLKDNLFVFNKNSHLSPRDNQDVTAVLCEEVSNFLPASSRLLRKSSSGVDNNSSIELSDVLSTSFSITLIWKKISPQPTTFVVNHFPNHGHVATRNANNITLSGLRPATTYKITLRPVFLEGMARPTSFVYSTAPSLLSELSTSSLITSDPCQLQAELEILYNVQEGTELTPFDCLSSTSMTIIDVNWKVDSTRSFFYTVRTIPPLPYLINLPESTARRVFARARPGTNYTIIITTRTLRQNYSKVYRAYVTPPPLPPPNILFQSVSNQNLLLWSSPQNSEYDSFVVEIVSSQGRVVHIMTLDPVSEQGIFNFSLNDFSKLLLYRINIYSKSENVMSKKPTTFYFSPSDSKAVNSKVSLSAVLLSTTDGIYCWDISLKNTMPRKRTIKKLLSVTSGVVNTIYIRHLSNGVMANSEPWKEYIVWIERSTREIKLTSLATKLTTTIVDGLLQPVGLVADSYDGNIYFSDIGSGAIGVVKLHLSKSSRDPVLRANRHLIRGGKLVTPISLAIDPIKRKLYWADLAGRIECSDLDGGSRKVLVNNVYTYDITYSMSTDRLYWINLATNQLEFIGFDGSRQTSLPDQVPLGEIGEISFVTTFGETLFVAYSESKSIGEIMLPISNISDSRMAFETIQRGLNVSAIAGISAFDYTAFEHSVLHRNEAITFPCANGGMCDEVCISTSLSKSYCTGQCSSWEKLCSYRSGTCINSLLWCDGKSDCPNGEDEFECSVSNVEPHNVEEFFSCNGSDKYIPSITVCDGRIDCRDGSDEIDCSVQKQTCQFEENLCLWKQSSDDDFDWKIWHRHTPSNSTGPVLDHTKIRINSSYVYAEATDQDEGAVAIMESVWLARPVCIKFYYHMFGVHIGSLTLNHRMQNSSQTEELWRKSGNQGIFWKFAQVSVKRHGLYQVLFEAVRGKDYRSDIALDDVVIEDGLCDISKKCSFQEFDDLLCGFEQGAMDTKDWTVWSGPNKPWTTEPFPIDENINRDTVPEVTRPLDMLGHEWFYFNFASDNKSGCNECNGTRLVRELSSYGSPKFAGIVVCESNKYKIFLSESLHGKFRNIADTSGNGDDHCEFVGSNDLASEVGEFRTCQDPLAYARSSWFEPVQPPGVFYDPSKLFSPSYYRCDLHIPTSVIANDPAKRQEKQQNYFLYFDAGIKGSANFKISVYKSTKEKAPQKGFTLPMVPSFPFNASDLLSATSTLQPIRRIVNPKPLPSPIYWCLSFRYHLTGSNVGSLKVSINNLFVIWTVKKDQGEEWQNATVTIPVPDVKYDLVFTAQSSEGFIGYIAVDDVELKEGACFRPQAYTCTFEKPLNQECVFFVEGNEVDYVPVNKLYARQKFDPVIIDSLNEPAVMLTYSGDPTMHQTQPVLKALLPGISQSYPHYCFSIHYRQKADDGNLIVILRNVLSDEFSLVSSYQLNGMSNVRPWLVMKTEINSTNWLGNAGAFILEFHGLSLIWANAVSIETKPCPGESEMFCNNRIRCRNNVCVKPHHLCDGLNDCGDWSDEIGCPSYCGTVADIFERNSVLVNATDKRFPIDNRCIWRIHGNRNKNILVQVGAISNQGGNSAFKLNIYQGLSTSREPILSNLSSDNFPGQQLLVTKNNFKNPSKYIVEDSEATIVLTFSGRVTMPSVDIAIEQVNNDHCRTKCSDSFCVTDNYFCDGIIGCPDESDENNCTRISQIMGENVLEVRRLTPNFSVLCGDHITTEMADVACQQVGFSEAKLPLRFVTIPHNFRGSTLYRLHQNISGYPSYVQAHISFNDEVFEGNSFPKTGDGSVCSSGKAWVADCIPYECGIRPRSDLNKPILRIVGGNMSDRARWPWMASLQVDGLHKCGGTLITNRHVLTVAHCFDYDSPTDFTVVTGANDLDPLDEGHRKYFVKRGILHDNYDRTALIPDWDIAILELQTPVRLSRYTNTACIPDGNRRFRPGDKCYVAGYGRLKENGSNTFLLYDAITPILAHEDCDKGWYDGYVSPRMICAGYPNTGGIGFCHGDSGGPLLCETDEGRWYLAGVISWSMGCALRRKPDVFSEVQYFIDWISLHTDLNLTVPDYRRPGTCGGTYSSQTSGSFATPGWPDNYLSNHFCLYRILASPGQTIRLHFDTFLTDVENTTVDVFYTRVGFSTLNASLSGSLSSHERTYETNDTSLEVAFISYDGEGDLGFYALWNISGEPHNYTGPTQPIHILPSITTPTPSLSGAKEMLGLFIFSGHMVGYRPMYYSTSLKDPNLSSKGYQLFYHIAGGQWRIISKLSDRVSPSGNWLYINDTSANPSELGHEWNYWSGSSWHNLDLDVKLKSAGDMMMGNDEKDLLNGLDSLQISEECSFVLKSSSGVIVSPGFPFHSSSPQHMACMWYLNPSGRSKDVGNSSKWILITIDYYNTVDQLSLYRGQFDDSKEPLYRISGRAVIDRGFLHNNMLNATKSDAGTPNRSSSHRTQSVNPPSLEDVIVQILRTPLCHDYFTKFSKDPCAQKTYTIFQALHATASILQCSLLMRCRNVDWCKLNELIYNIPSDGLTKEIATFITANRCDDPLWIFPYIAADDSSSQSNDKLKLHIFYDDSNHEGISLAFTASGEITNGEGFYMHYDTLYNLDESTYDVTSNRTLFISQDVSHRIKRTAQNHVQTSFFGHPSILPNILNTQTTTAPPQTLANVSHLTSSSQPTVSSRTSLPKSTPPTLVNSSFSIVFSSCPHTVTPVDGAEATLRITSPNYPGNYNSNSRCVWTFTTWPDYQVIMEFSIVDIESHAECTYDAVTVFDGPHTRGIKLSTFCGFYNASIPPQKSSGQSLTVVFHSDSLVNMPGFSAIVTARPISQSKKNIGDVEHTLFHCNFSHHLCGFIHDLDAQFTWTRNVLTTPSEGTGPPYDASFDGTGSYVFIEASRPRKPGEKAALMSPRIFGRPDIPVCLRFSYDMYGSNTGFLNVFVDLSMEREHSSSTFEDDGIESVVSTQALVYKFGAGIAFKEMKTSNTTMPTQRYLLWRKSGEQRSVREKPWVEAAITFYPFNDFQIVFEGVRGPGFRSDIAIDEVRITEGECQATCRKDGGLFKCSTAELDTENVAEHCIPKEFECDGKADCNSGADERLCFSSIRRLCAAELENDRSQGVDAVCSPEIIDRCRVRSSNITRVADILCDGIADCFGGADEAFCDNDTISEEPKFVGLLQDSCGFTENQNALEETSPYPVASEPSTWPWVAGLYVAKNHFVSLEDSSQAPQELTGYTFLCSVVFIRPMWALVPAHCILNPSLYSAYSVLNKDKENPEDDEMGLAEFDNLSESTPDVADEESNTFSYAVVSPLTHDTVESGRSAWRVARWIVHPEYEIQQEYANSSEAGANSKGELNVEDVRADANRIARDIALLKLEPDNSILAQNNLPSVAVTDDIGPPVGEEQYVVYDGTYSADDFNGTTGRSSACLEVTKDETPSAMITVKHQKLTGSFVLPSESSRFPSLYESDAYSLPNRATCYSVGHSPIYIGSTEEEDRRLVWSLRHYSVAVTAAEVTSPFLFCEAYDDANKRNVCLDGIRIAEQPPNNPNTFNLHPTRDLIKIGYESKRIAAFKNDQGSMLFCRQHDNRWFIAGLYNLINFRRNVLNPNYTAIFDDISNKETEGSTFYKPTLGIPIGMDYLTKMTPALNKWIDKSLSDSCPGQFSCYAPQSDKSECLPLSKKCDGTIDCSASYADEMDCLSGCAYDPDLDPFNRYYSSLKEGNVWIPKQVFEFNKTDVDKTKFAWINGTEQELKTIRFNKVEGRQIKSCHWTINPPEGKVAIFRIPKMNTNPVLDQGFMQVTSGAEKQHNNWLNGPHYFVSIPNKPITLSLLPAIGRKHLKDVGNHHFNYYTEDVGLCTNLHKCDRNKCISPHKVCDGELDCLDLSDELDCPSGCEGRSLYVGATQGPLLSRNYPLPYAGNGDCLWMIFHNSRRRNVSPPTEITIQFIDFITSPLDKMFVYSGVGSSRTVHGIYSGNAGKFNVTIPASEATIQLLSNDGVAERRVNGRFFIKSSIGDL
ncbi:unnamed protein product [Clavelina lepadiformis]|uniref:Low-density lipoprotein receptor relative with 11 ligand-binding repeats n=1 Tax=Clavelina lepadiformis TaxID=159417 RepID=A0ABP0GHY7_CLALP